MLRKKASREDKEELRRRLGPSEEAQDWLSEFALRRLNEEEPGFVCPKCGEMHVVIEARTLVSMQCAENEEGVIVCADKSPEHGRFKYPDDGHALCESCCYWGPTSEFRKTAGW